MTWIPGQEELGAKRTVWVVMPTGYDQYGINGIFDSLEAAKASRPDAEWIEDRDGAWEAVRQDLLIYEEEVQSVRPAAAASVAERERVRTEVRRPLPYEVRGAEGPR